MRRFFSFLTRGERETSVTPPLLIDENVGKLYYDSTLLLTRRLMTLSRRRRCATEHLEGMIGQESSIDFVLHSWYQKKGHNRLEILDSAAADLKAINENP